LAKPKLLNWNQLLKLKPLKLLAKLISGKTLPKGGVFLCFEHETSRPICI
jgi:hypothetical protein